MDIKLSNRDKDKSSYINIENNFSVNNKQYKKIKEKDEDCPSDNSISMILNEYENKIKKLVTNNKDKERIKML